MHHGIYPPDLFPSQTGEDDTNGLLQVDPGKAI